MSMHVEQSGKGGRVCARSYRNGDGCPLIVRSTSEDVVTGNAFGLLRHLRPSLWLRPLLVAAFGKRFERCNMHNVTVKMWPELPPPSTKHEGWSQPDVLIEFGDVVVVIEAKYRAGLSMRTTRDPARDQLARLLDVAYQFAIDNQFFRRDPYVLVLGLRSEEPALVTRYRDATELAAVLGHYPEGDRARMATTMSARVGYANWLTLSYALGTPRGRLHKLERALLSDLAGYLRFKVQTADLSPYEERQPNFFRLSSDGETR